ncbi:MAG TPA: hypothetical protein DCG37_02630 [Lachnospiraceae bacterium]|nr:hypothetical protein [Lachnospiraceae bacterium]
MSFPGNRKYKNKSLKPRTDAKEKTFLSASVAVELALVLPLWLFGVVTLITFMQAVKIQNVKNLELSNKARSVAMYSGVIETEGEGHWIDFSQNYTFRYPGALGNVLPLRIALRARVYPWIGYGGKEDAESAGSTDGNEAVFLTDHESVYHTHVDCSHLDLTIFRTNMSEVGNLRNQYGERYRPCSSFPVNYDGPVYVTAKGTYYYPSTDHHSLTRHVRMVNKADYPSLHICERCAARDAVS